MRLMLHYAGDIHQPLHATSRVDHEYPQGDRGGNSFKLPSKDGANNLHAVWDSIIYEFTGYPTLPFSDADWAKNGNVAKELMAKYPLEDSIAKDTNVLHWAEDSFKVSSTFLYKDIKENTPLPEDYDEKARAIAER